MVFWDADFDRHRSLGLMINQQRKDDHGKRRRWHIYGLDLGLLLLLGGVWLDSDWYSVRRQ